MKMEVLKCLVASCKFLRGAVGFKAWQFGRLLALAAAAGPAQSEVLGGAVQDELG